MILDPKRPLKVRHLDKHRAASSQRELDGRGYRVLGRDLDNPNLLLISPALGGTPLVIDPTTGRIASGQWGSNLEFYNEPSTTTENSVIYTTTGQPVAVTLTLVDGVPISIDLNPNPGV
jgi:hypothetical protein